MLVVETVARIRDEFFRKGQVDQGDRGRSRLFQFGTCHFGLRSGWLVEPSRSDHLNPALRTPMTGI